MASGNEDTAEATSGPTEISALTMESVRMVADANSVSIPILDEGARELAEQATYRIRTLLQTAQKFAMHSKRRKLNPEDLDLALRAQGQEPLYGLCAADHIPFRLDELLSVLDWNYIVYIFWTGMRLEEVVSCTF